MTKSTAMKTNPLAATRLLAAAFSYLNDDTELVGFAMSCGIMSAYACKRGTHCLRHAFYYDRGKVVVEHYPVK